MHRLEGVAERLSAQGRFGLAVAAALAAVRAGAYRESAHPPSSRPISPRATWSRPRRAYAACRMVLTCDLGVEPSPVTTRLVFPLVGAAAGQDAHVVAG